MEPEDCASLREGARGHLAGQGVERKGEEGFDEGKEARSSGSCNVEPHRCGLLTRGKDATRHARANE